MCPIKLKKMIESDYVITPKKMAKRFELIQVGFKAAGFKCQKCYYSRNNNLELVGRLNCPWQVKCINCQAQVPLSVYFPSDEVKASVPLNSDLNTTASGNEKEPKSDEHPKVPGDVKASDDNLREQFEKLKIELHQLKDKQANDFAAIQSRFNALKNCL